MIMSEVVAHALPIQRMGVQIHKRNAHLVFWNGWNKNFKIQAINEQEGDINMTKLHKIECVLYISFSMVIGCICCIYAVTCDDWLKTVILVIASIIMFYYSINGVLYMIKKTILDSLCED